VYQKDDPGTFWKVVSSDVIWIFNFGIWFKASPYFGFYIPVAFSMTQYRLTYNAVPSFPYNTSNVFTNMREVQCHVLNAKQQHAPPLKPKVECI